MVVEGACPAELVRFQLGEWTSVPWMMLLDDPRALDWVVLAEESIVGVDVCVTWFDALP